MLLKPDGTSAAALCSELFMEGMRIRFPGIYCVSFITKNVWHIVGVHWIKPGKCTGLSWASWYALLHCVDVDSNMYQYILALALLFWFPLSGGFMMLNCKLSRFRKRMVLSSQTCTALGCTRGVVIWVSGYKLDSKHANTWDQINSDNIVW